MKIKPLALLVCATLSSFTALAGQSPISDIAWQGHTYPAVMVKMKATPGLTRQQLPALLALNNSALNVSAAFQHKTARGAELSELQALDAKYGFDRFLRITLPADKTRDIAYINSIVKELGENPNVEIVYADPESVSLGQGMKTRSTAATAASVADYRNLQYYLRAPNDIPSGYKMGGVNRDSVNQYAGHEGENVTILSNEIGKWNQNHVNLPKAVFAFGTPINNEHNNEHDTASVGIMAATDIGAGIKGLVWNTHLAYATDESQNLYNAIPKLQAGDVVQIGIQTSGGEVTGCTSDCWLPMEHKKDYFQVIKALTDKGVHVIEAAANGNLNLDHSAFGGAFNANTNDSGAIIVGAIDPKTGVRASFSNYSSRITSNSWGQNVTTTGFSGLSSVQNANYTSTFNGTSSANPIVAGVVASLSSIAKAHGKTITPKQMRDILNQTGTVLAGNASSQIGTQPDMGRAVERILELGGEVQSSDAAFVAGLQVNMPSTDNGDSVTFNGNVMSNATATSTPTYSWALPSGAQGSNSGTSSQSFTVNKTSQAQNLTVSVTVKAGTESRVLTQTITVPALAVAGQYPTWDSNAAYVAHDKVSWNGGDYEAKWWTRGNEPGTSDAWESLNASQVSEWNSSMAYNGGDIVLFNGHTWKAKWWTKGNQPGTNDVWEQIS